MDSSSLTSNTDLWAPHRRNAVDWQPPPIPTTIVVPHPDDEALMFGGLIQRQRQRGVDVHVIAVTDGEASHPDADRRQLAAARRREQGCSLERLGVDGSAVTRLALPDGDLAGREDTIKRAIEEALEVSGHGLIAAPWIHDHHADHEACGRAALAAASRSGAMVAAGLFWAWRHTHPRHLERRLARLAINDDQRNVKGVAVSEHSTQLEGESPVVTTDDLTPTTWNHEYYVIPAADPAVMSAARSAPEAERSPQ